VTPVAPTAAPQEARSTDTEKELGLMAKPFVSYDGADERGVRAQVWVQVGTGTVTKIEHQDDETKQNVMVVLKSDHSAVKRPIKGWMSKKDPAYEAVVTAARTGQEVEYRVESQRKAGVDRTVPITDLRADTETAGANTISILAGIDGVLTQEAVTTPTEDPAAGGRIPAPRDAAGPVTGAGGDQVDGLTAERMLSALATARRTGLSAGVADAAAALALAAGASAQQVQDAGFSPQAAGARVEPRRAHAQEAAPHIRFNSDHRVNLGSYAVQAAFSAEQVAYEILAAAEQRVFEAHNAAVASGQIKGDPMVAPVPVDLTQAASLARVLLALADRVQVGAYGGGHPDRMANSHTRARSLVFDAVRTRYPVPFGMGSAARQGWMDSVVAEGVHRFRTLTAVSQEVPELPQPAEQDPQPAGRQGRADGARTEDAQGEAAPSEVTRGRAARSDAAQDDTAEDETAQDGAGASTGAQGQAARGDASAPQAARGNASVAEAPEADAGAAEGPQGDVSAPQAPEAEGARPRRSSSPRPPVKGQGGFTAPSSRLVGRFGALVERAGFSSATHGPVLTYLEEKFGVTRAREVHGPALESLVRWYEQREDGVAAFRRHVLALSSEGSQRASA
jgi:hypothetical protein